MATFYRTSKQPTIYEQGKEGDVLRPIIGEETFKQRGGVFGEEQIITPERLQQFRLGTPIGREFIKSPSAPDVFRVTDSELRPVQSEKAFEQLTGGRDFSQVANVPQEQISRMRLGSPILEQPVGLTTEPKTVPEASGVVTDILEKSGVDPEREQKRQGLFTKVAEAIRGAPKEVAETRTAAAEEFGLSEKEAAVSGILEKATNLKTQYLQGIEQLRAKPISAALIQGREGLLQRQMSIELQGLAALADIAQGDVQAAQDKIDQSVEDALAIEQANIDAFKVEMEGMELSDIEKLRFDFMLSERERQLEKENDLAQEKKALTIQLAQAGIESSPLETFDNLVEKLRQTAGIEASKSYLESVGLISNPFTGEIERTLESKLKIEGHELNVQKFQETIRKNKVSELIKQSNLDIAQKKLAISQADFALKQSKETAPDTLRDAVLDLSAGQQEGAWGAIASFKNAKDILDLIEEGAKTGPLSAPFLRGVSLFGKTIIPGKMQLGWSGETQNKLLAAMTAFSANYIKGISGVAVSEQEYKRLLGALPDIAKQENVIKDQLPQLLKTMQNKYETQLGINFSDFPEQIPPELVGETNFIKDFLNSF